MTLDNVTQEEFIAAIKLAGGSTHQYGVGPVTWWLEGVSGQFSNGKLEIGAYQGRKDLVEAGASMVRGAVAAYHVQTAAERFGWVSEREGNEITLSRRAF